MNGSDCHSDECGNCKCAGFVKRQASGSEAPE